MKGKMIPMKQSMVKAILAERKSETRRPISPYPSMIGWIDGSRTLSWKGTIFNPYTALPEKQLAQRCPYGKPGDLLLIRESAQVLDVHRHGRHDDRTDFIKVCYNADGHETDWIEYPERLKWRPEVGASLPRGVYREAARIQLRIVDVAVEQLHDITDAGILAEGVYQPEGSILWEAAYDLPRYDSPSTAFIALWDFRLYLNRGPKWAENPWCWRVRFERVR